jgi:hypothetical protein
MNCSPFFPCEGVFQISVQLVYLRCKFLEVGFIDTPMRRVGLLQRGQYVSGLDFHQRWRQPDVGIKTGMFVMVFIISRLARGVHLFHDLDCFVVFTFMMFFSWSS